MKFFRYILIFTVFIFGAVAARDNQDQPGIGQAMYSKIESEGIDAAIAFYWKAKEQSPDKYDFSEGQLNNLGYRLMREGKMQDAVQILELNAQAFPKSPNVYDSLGEVYLKMKNFERAEESYKKVLEVVEESNLDASTKSFFTTNAKARLVSMNEASQFDFWLGEWRVERQFLRSDGTWFTWTDTCKTAKVADGNAVIDYWNSLKSPTRSLFIRTFNATTAEWEITGVGNRALAGFTIWKGKFRDGEGVFTNEKINPAGQPQITRITFFDIKKDSFLWKFERSVDDGKTWQTTLKNEFIRIADQANIVIH